MQPDFARERTNIKYFVLSVLISIKYRSISLPQYRYYYISWYIFERDSNYSLNFPDISKNNL